MASHADASPPTLGPPALRSAALPSVRMKPPRGPMASALDAGGQCNFTIVHSSGLDDAVVDGGLAHEGHARLSAARPPPVLRTYCSLNPDTNTIFAKSQARTTRKASLPSRLADLPFGVAVIAELPVRCLRRRAAARVSSARCALGSCRHPCPTRAARRSVARASRRGCRRVLQRRARCAAARCRLRPRCT